MSLQRRTALAVLARQRQIAQARNERHDLLDRQVGSWRKWYKKRLELLRQEKKDDRDLVKVFQLSLYGEEPEMHSPSDEYPSDASQQESKQLGSFRKETSSVSQLSSQPLSSCDPVGLVGDSHQAASSREALKVFHVGSSGSGIGEKLLILKAPLDSLDLYQQNNMDQKDAQVDCKCQKDINKVSSDPIPEKDNSIYLSLLD